MPLSAPGGRSAAATLLDAGFVFLIVVVVIGALDNLVLSMAIKLWPWWVTLFASIAGIAVSLGALRKYPVRAGILTGILAWNLLFSASIIGFWSSSNLTAVLRIEFLAGAVVSAALCVWVGVLLSRGDTTADLFLAIFLGLFAVGLVLAAVASSQPQGSAWYPAGVVLLASALVLPLALIRAHRSAVEPAPGP